VESRPSAIACLEQEPVEWAKYRLECWLTSALGHKQTSRDVSVTSALPPKADIRQRIEHVCFVPEADIR
jgi:hypothetical protein